MKSLALYYLKDMEVELGNIVCWEPIVEDVFNNLKRGMVVVDVGSAYGYYAIKASLKVREEGKVLAVEPTIAVYKLLLKNIELYNLKNTIAINKALSDKKTEATLYESISRGGGVGSNIGFVRGCKRFYKVQVETLDNLIKEQGLSKVDLIKIDVQGFESQVLQGAHSILQKYKPQLAVEVHARSPRWVAYLIPRRALYKLNKMLKGKLDVVIRFYCKLALLSEYKKIIEVIKPLGYVVKCEGHHKTGSALNVLFVNKSGIQ